MKRNVIIRIVIYSLVLILLLAGLAIGLSAGMFMFNPVRSSEGNQVSSGSVAAEGIRNLDIEWASGNIMIERDDTDAISFWEIGSGDANPLVYLQNGNTLSIKYEQQNSLFGFSSTANKDLIITVPVDWMCHELSVDAASANLSVTSLTINEVDLDLASGNCTFTDSVVDELSLDCASGNIEFSGTLNTLDCDTASGSVTAVLNAVPKRIDFDGASADLDLTLPDGAGFSVSLDSVSGNFYSDFETAKQGSRYICGDGTCQIDVDGVSGDIIIRKGK